MVLPFNETVGGLFLFCSVLQGEGNPDFSGVEILWEENHGSQGGWGEYHIPTLPGLRPAAAAPPKRISEKINRTVG